MLFLNPSRSFPALLATILLAPIFAATPASALSKTFSWTPPTTNVDSSPITNLSGFEIGIGTTPGNYLRIVNVGNTSSAAIDFPVSGTFHAAVRAYNTTGVRSAFSNSLMIEINNPENPLPPVPTEDGDGDGVSDLSDNCPNQTNVDQSDRDGDGRGDLCDKGRGQLACDASTMGTSRLSLLTGGRHLMADPVSLEAVGEKTGSGIVLVANFIAETAAERRSTQRITKLEVARVTGLGRLQLEVMEGAAKKTTKLKAKGNTILACHADSNPYAEVVSVHRGVITIEPLGGRARTIRGKVTGTVLSASCADVSGDGVDELIMLEQLRTRGRASTNLVTVDLRRGTRKLIASNLSNVFSVGATDADDDGIANICTAHSRPAPAISCRTAGGIKTVVVPSVKEFAGGVYFKNENRSEAGLSVLGRDGVLRLFDFKGNSFAATPVLTSGPVPVSTRARIAQCR